MTRSACLVGASALALAILLNVHVADAQDAADGAQSANRILQGGAPPLTSQTGSDRAGLSASPSLAGVAVVQSIAVAGAGPNDRQTENEKSAKIASAEKADLASPPAEQKQPAEINQGDPPAAAKQDS